MNGLVWEGIGPAAAAGALALALALAALLVWMRPLSRRAVVAFVPLWERAMARSLAGIPWREALALLFFVSALGSLAAALAGPRLESRPPRRVAIVLDVSASMDARDARGERRIDQARRAMARVARSLAPGDGLAMFRTASTVRTIAPSELSALSATDESADFEAAGAAAVSYLAEGAPEHRRRLVVISDRPETFPDPIDPKILVDRIAVGVSGENLAVAAFGVSSGTASEGGLDLLVTVANEGGSDATAELVLHTDAFRLGGGAIEVAAGARETRAYHLPGLAAPSRSPGGLPPIPPLEGELWASLDGIAFASGAADALRRDDRRVAWAADRGWIEVALVGDPPSRFLEGALAAQGGVRVRRVTPAGAARGGLEGVDVAVFDGVPPPARLPPGLSGVLRFGPEVGAATVGAAVLTDWNGRHPVTARVSLDDLTLAEAGIFPVSADDEVLAATREGPIAIARVTGGGRTVHVGFDPAKSDFPLRLGFPVFVGSAVRWLAGVDGERLTFGALAGHSVLLPAAADARLVDAVVEPFSRAGSDPDPPNHASPGEAGGGPPESAHARITRRPGGWTFVAERAGLFTVDLDGVRWRVEVGIDPEESSAAVAVPSAGATDGSSAIADVRLPDWTRDEAPASNRELIPWLFAAAALLFSLKAWLG